MLAQASLAGQENDNFADRLTLTGEKITVSADNTGATTEPDEDRQDEDDEFGTSLWWQWTAPSDGLVVIDTAGSRIDTGLGVFSGNTLSEVEVIAFNDDDIDLQSRVDFVAAAGATYLIAVFGYLNEEGPITLSLELLPPPTPPAQFPDLTLATNGVVDLVEVQKNGKIIIAGRFTAVNGVARNNLARLNPNGSVDASWNPVAEGESIEVYAMVIHSGSLFIGGAFDRISGHDLQNFAKLDLAKTGEADPDWDLNPDGSVRAIALIGQLLFIGGEFFTVGGEDIAYLAKVNSEGVVSSNWNPQVDNTVENLAVSPDGVFASGLFENVGSIAMPGLAKMELLGTGRAVEEWNPRFDPGDFENQINTLAIDGEALYVGGSYDSIGGLTVNNLVRLDTTGRGEVDTTWLPEPNDDVLSIQINEEKIFTSGHFTEIKGEDSFFLAKLSKENADPDLSFRIDLQVPIELIKSSPDGLLVVGKFNQLNSESATFGIARVGFRNGSPDPSFYVQIEKTGSVNAALVQNDGKIVIGGDFLFANGFLRKNILRLNKDGSLDQDWVPETDAPVLDLAKSENDIIIAGEFFQVSGQVRPGIAKLKSTGPGEIDPFWNPQPNGSVTDLLADPNGDFFVAGTFSEIGGVDNGGLAKISGTGNGEADPLWDPYPDGSVCAMALVGDHLYVGGLFTNIGNIDIINFAKISVIGSGEADPAFNKNLDELDFLEALEIIDNKLIIGGCFLAIEELPIQYLARMNLEDDTIDQTWTPNPDDMVTILESTENTLYTGGLFSKIGGLNRSFVAKLDLDGNADASWAPNPEPLISNVDLFDFPVVRSITVGASGIYIGGEYQTIGDVPRNSFSLIPIARKPVLVQLDENTVMITRNLLNGEEVSHFKVTKIRNGKLFLADGFTRVLENDFITVEQGLEGLHLGIGASITVVSAVDNTTGGAGTKASTLTMQENGFDGALFQLAEAHYEVSEGSGSINVTVVKIGNAHSSVEYRTSEISASAGIDFEDIKGRIVFAEGETSKQVTIRLVDDYLLEDDEAFSFNLLPGRANAQFLQPASATIEINDNDHVGFSESILDNVLPDPLLPPDSDGIITVSISPPEANGQWRLAGEPAFLDGGVSIGGLATGNYTVEFKPSQGYFTPPSEIVPIISGETYNLSITYTASAPSTVGDLTVMIEPAGIGGRWRRQGESIWHDSGEKLVGLNEGVHVVEFEDVPGRATPSEQIVTVSGAQNNLSTATYLVSPEIVGDIPLLLPFESNTPDEASATATPYLYCGQISSDLGQGSGVAVKKRVVLTAAHVLFDDNSLSYVTEARWLPQRYKETHESVPLTARGWYVFEGYAAQRAIDNSPGISSPESQNQDAAAMYFLEDVARGGYSGFLSSDAINNEWLVSSRLKMLVGYPMNGIDQEHFGKMFATPPTNYNFSLSSGRVFKTEGFTGFPGNSGGPVFVQEDNGTFYPAGIYLGGSQNSLVRAIDAEVVDLINRAEISGDGGSNNASGGVALLTSGLTVSPFAAGSLTVNITPSAAALAGAGWRVDGGADEFSASGVTLSLVEGDYLIQFSSIKDYTKPEDRIVHITGDQTTLIDTEYIFTGEDAFVAWAGTKITSEDKRGPTDDPDLDGVCNLMEFFLGLTPMQPQQSTLSTVAINGNEFSLTFPRSKSAANVSFTVMKSTDLQTWTSEDITLTKIGDSEEAETWKASCIGDDPNVYLKVDVEQ